MASPPGRTTFLIMVQCSFHMDCLSYENDKYKAGWEGLHKIPRVHRMEGLMHEHMQTGMPGRPGA